MLNCNMTAIPMNENEKLQLNDGTEKEDERYYRSLVWGLIYLIHSRPGIYIYIFSIDIVSKFMHNPTKYHLGEAKRVLR